MGNTRYKLWYCDVDRIRDRVRIIIEPRLEDKVVEVKRVGDMIIVQVFLGGRRQSMPYVPMLHKRD